MGAEERQNGQGGCIAIRSFPPPSISRCTIGGSSTTTSDDATCGSPRWIGKSLSCVCIKRKGNYERICMTLTPLQNERLQRLKQRMKVYFDPSRRDHQEALKALWHATYPDQELEGLISDQWKAMGWQGRDPSTDFRCRIHFIGEPTLLCKDIFYIISKTAEQTRREESYMGVPICGGWSKYNIYDHANARPAIYIACLTRACSVNTRDLADIVQIWRNSVLSREPLLEPFLFKCSQRMNGHLIYFIALPSWYWINNGLKRMPPTWISIALVHSLQAQINTKGGKDVSDTTYQEVLRSTRVQLERELLLDDVMRIEDMPSYSNLS